MNSDVVDRLLSLNSPYVLDKYSKRKELGIELDNLDDFHKENCVEYANILNATNYSQYPLPVRLFKELNLKSVPDENVFKVLTSSGTTSQVVSRIHLDRETAQLQTKVLVQIMQSFLGKDRLPMLIIDHPNVIRNRASFSARGAGILGLSNFGRKHTYALDDDMKIDFDVIENFLNSYKGQTIFIFGFTFMVWQYFLQQLKKENRKIDFGNSILVHSGGWKKLQDQAVDNETFKNEIREWTGIKKIYNFYGMVEQVGSIFVECENGVLHCPNFSDVYFLDLNTMQEVGVNQKGVISVESIIPRSYPGHRLLTEDIGTLLGEDDCSCGRKGKYFSVEGRMAKAEVRGCSDTHEK